jgi:hypothetical protein
MTRAFAIAIAGCVVAATPHDLRAESCTGVTKSGGRFATCFDLGNRFSVTAGSDGVGGGLALRHVIHFDDEPDLVWKLEHTLLDSTHAGFEDRFSGVVYRGRFLRHARDGHIVIPLGTPKKVFLPFDIGGLAEVGRVTWQPDTTIARLGVVKMAALFDLARTRGFRRRIAFGPVARWDVDVDSANRELAEHIVSPFTSGIVSLKAESASGRMVGEITIEAGTVWRNKVGWTQEAQAEATLERIMLAVNDRPIALVVGVRYATATDEAIARIGARVVLFHRRDPRVRLASSGVAGSKPRAPAKQGAQEPRFPWRAVLLEPEPRPEPKLEEPEPEPEPEPSKPEPASEPSEPSLWEFAPSPAPWRFE